MDIYLLKRIARQARGALDTTKLEQDFLDFSSYMPEKTLLVELPRLYKLKGKEREHFSEVLSLLEIKADVPEAVDFSGSFDYSSMSDAIAFVSLQQLNADHYSSSRSYLNLLLQEIYSNGAQIIKDFAIHEGVCSKVTCRRGGLDLREAHLFPERFIPGPYLLEVELETPKGVIKRFMELGELLEQFKKSPQEHILNPEKVQKAVSETTALRKDLGSLSRYDQPKTQTFDANTNSCIIRNENNTLFYLYSPEQKRNILVYFGESPFPEEEPRNLVIMKGDEHHHTLAQLVEFGIFKPSDNILEMRIADLAYMRDSMIRDKTKGNGLDIQKLIDSLEIAQEYFSETLNPEMRRSYVTRLSPELIEFMVYPAIDDPIIHELLPRVSWNKTVRSYHDTRNFIVQFEKANKKEKRAMLKEVQSNLMFCNQQNNNVNVWLYQNHKELCSGQGLKFEVNGG